MGTRHGLRISNTNGLKKNDGPRKWMTVTDVRQRNKVTLPFSEKALIQQAVDYSEEDSKQLASKLPIVRTSQVIFDKDNHLPGLFLPQGLSLPWCKEKGDELAEIQSNAAYDLVDAYPPPMPTPSDGRHVDPVERKHLEETGQPH